MSSSNLVFQERSREEEIVDEAPHEILRRRLQIAVRTGNGKASAVKRLLPIIGLPQDRLGVFPDEGSVEDLATALGIIIPGLINEIDPGDYLDLKESAKNRELAHGVCIRPALQTKSAMTLKQTLWWLLQTTEGTHKALQNGDVHLRIAGSKANGTVPKHFLIDRDPNRKEGVRLTYLRADVIKSNMITPCAI